MFEATILGTELCWRIAARSLIQLKRIKSNAIKSSISSTNIIIRAGEREKAIKDLKEWFTQHVRDYLKICDPFFGVNDLEVLQHSDLFHHRVQYPCNKQKLYHAQCL